MDDPKQASVGQEDMLSGALTDQYTELLGGCEMNEEVSPKWLVRIISDIRKAFGDSGKTQVFVRTVRPQKAGRKNLGPRKYCLTRTENPEVWVNFPCRIINTFEFLNKAYESNTAGDTQEAKSLIEQAKEGDVIIPQGMLQYFGLENV